MEPSQFDEFTKAMATPTSRRKALKRLAIGTFGSLLTLAGLSQVFAKTKCPPGLTNCHGKCVDTKKDPNNCGVCGTVCASGICINGVCCPPGSEVCSTPSGPKCCSFTCCGGVHEQVCIDTEHDVNNCGGCGNVCPAGDTCKNGKCVAPPPCMNNVCMGGACPFIGPCGPGGSCFCYTVPDGTGGCGPSIPCFGAKPCTTCADCPSGSFCAINTCCGQAGICIPNCGGGGAPKHVNGPSSAHR